MKNIWIVAESVPFAAGLIAGAKSLAPQARVAAYIQGDEDVAKQAYAYGVETAYALPLQPHTLWEQDYLVPFADKVASEKPDLVLFGTSRRCRDLAAQLAARLDIPLLSDAKNLAAIENGVSGESMVYGGLAVKSVEVAAPIIFATVSAQTYEADKPDAGKSGEVVSMTASLGNAKVTARQAKEVQGVNLGDAKIVVGVGRGLGERSDLDIVQTLVKTLKAEIACTRPIADFFKWLPEETYLGVSGQVIKPQLYIAVGISGQAQHYYGVRDAKTIVSINKDPEALMNKNADYYIVGDLREVVPTLSKILNG